VANTPYMSPSEQIDLLGGTTAVARLAGVKPPSVSDWRHNGVPDDKLILLAVEIERRSNHRVRRWDLFPATWHRIWPELVGAPGAPAMAEASDAA